ncbi:MAG: MiaB/RimO family radical SAM methylthiotransferase [Phycisphaerae bacterium]|nr:MiaB/RimO family radical SAM methylthiotransferase [Phycisphaerae bacterium]
MGWKYRVSTLGCKVNQYESQQVREILESLGGKPALQGEQASIAVVNTCAVTTNALRRSGQEVRRLLGGPAEQIVVFGCGASADADRFRRIDGVDAVWGHGTDLRKSLCLLLEARPPVSSGTPSSENNHVAHDAGDNIPGQAIGTRTTSGLATPGPATHDRRLRQAPPIHPLPIIPLEDEGVKAGTPIGLIRRFDRHQRAFLKIQDGCDAHCTYCIIPRLRPDLRSKSVHDAVAEARQLVAAGHREIVLTGIFLGAYGRETALRRRIHRHDAPLAELVDALAQVEGLARLRLSSLEPGDVGHALLDVLRRHENCVPHLHLPLQSGSEDVLRRMNRQYDRENFHEMVERVRTKLQRPAISTDVIVGFPGESEGDFAKTLETARFAGFIKIHAFPFSPRAGTAAARWQRQFIRSDVVRERMNRLAELERELSLTFRQQAVGSVERVIVESTAGDGDEGPPGHSSVRPAPVNSEVLAQGRTDRYFRVHFPSGRAIPGNLVRVRIQRATPTRTHGTVVTSRPDRPPDIERATHLSIHVG